MKNEKRQLRKENFKNKDSFEFLLCIFTFSFLIFNLGFAVYASTQDEITIRQQQIEELQQQIEEYQQQIETNRSQARTLETEINGLNAQIRQIELTIRSLELSIGQTSDEISDTEFKITDTETKMFKHKEAIGQFLKIIDQNDQKTLTEILLSNKDLSDFFTVIDSVRANQDKLRLTIEEMKELKSELEEKQDNLEEQKTEFERLRRLEALEKGSLDRNKSVKNKILKDTKGQESKFQELVKKSQKDIEAIRSQITYLQQYGVSAEEAVKFGNLAAIAAGIRPAFLIAILEIESGLGRNVGTGNWLDDMYKCYLRLRKPSRAEAEKAAFFEIINKLGLDPNTVKVSREPNYGCGGALGPAQFLPSTWLAYEEETARLTGHNPPNPWDIGDAFMASAIKLARGGATSKNKTGETRAAKAYISGKPTCTSSICNYYANAVLRKAAEIEKNL